jgi:hypothetical protein
LTWLRFFMKSSFAFIKILLFLLSNQDCMRQWYLLRSLVFRRKFSWRYALLRIPPSLCFMGQNLRLVYLLIQFSFKSRNPSSNCLLNKFLIICPFFWAFSWIHWKVPTTFYVSTSEQFFKETSFLVWLWCRRLYNFHSHLLLK